MPQFNMPSASSIMRRPSQAPKATQALETFLAAHPNVKVIKIQWLNLSGVSQCRVVPVERFRQTIAGDGVHPGSASIADMMMPATNEIVGEIMPYFTLTAKIVPDLNTLRICYDSAKLGNTALVFANIDFQDIDPRPLLSKMVAKAEKEKGLKFLVGIELEFCLLEMDGVTPPSTNTKSFHVDWITARSKFWPVLNEAIVALAEAGIPVIECHKEYDSSQFEIALPPLSPLESVDAAVYAREVIKDIAYRHNFIASFYPNPFSADFETQKSGQHVHISATPVSDSTKFEPDGFLGGLLTHLPALCAIGMASFDSYSRAEEGHINAGGRVGFGTNNRDLPIRKVSQNHWEVRTIDATANPYLMVSAIIAAGLDSKPLTWKDITTFPPMMSEEEQKAAGPVVPLPKSLTEGIEALEKDSKWAKAALGELVVDHYIINKKHESEFEGKKSEKERKMNIVRYF